MDHLIARIDGIDKATILTELERLREITGTGIDELHKLVYELRPMVLDNLGLHAAAREYVKTHLEPAGLHVDLKIIEAAHLV